jgi:hypothetical protein
MLIYIAAMRCTIILLVVKLVKNNIELVTIKCIGNNDVRT